MIITRIAGAIDGRIVAGDRTASDRGVTKVYAGNRISDILRKADSDTLLVSGIASRHLLDIAQLMDAPCVCLAGNAPADTKLVQAAESRGIALMVSPLGAAGICGRLKSSLSVETD